MSAVAVVTGCNGRIGSEIAAALADDFTVVGIDRQLSTMPFPLIVSDVADRASIETAAHQIVHEYGRVEIVVNNAGTLTMNRFLDVSDKDWDDVFRVNAYGTFVVSQVFARMMRNWGEGGRIINISSIAGKTPLPDQSHYCASKAAVIMLTRVMALELADAGIRVFSICPGAVDSALFRQCLTWSAQQEARAPEALLQEWLSPSRIGRLVEPSEIAAFVSFLAAGPSEALTGHAFSVDGGISPW